MNQIAFSSLHLAAMGYAGYMFGQDIKMNPKIGALAGIVSSICFQFMSEINHRIHLNDLENDLKYKTPEEQETCGRGARHVANGCSIIGMTFGIVLGANNTFAQATLMTLGLIWTSYWSARVGTYCFLGDKDFSILNVDRKRVW